MALFDISNLVDQLYDGVVSDEEFSRAIVAIGQSINAHASVAFSIDTECVDLWHRHEIDGEAFRAYEEHYFLLDIFKQALTSSGRLQSGVVFTDLSLVSTSEMRRSPLVQELLLPNDLGSLLGCPAHVTASGTLAEFAFYRKPGAEPFALEEMAFLRELAPHLGRASRLRLRLREAEAIRPWTAEFLNGLRWGVALLNAAGQILFVNREAERIIAMGDGLILSRSELRATHHENARALAQMIASVIRGFPRHTSRRGGDLAISRPSGERPWLLTVVPIGSTRDILFGMPEPRAAVHILDPSRRPSDPGMRLHTLFGLSPAEQHLALDLVRGVTLAESADRRTVALSTVKTQLLQLFAKTGTHRQSQLIALLSGCLTVPSNDRTKR